jgi:hypothetical protein
VRSKIRQAFYDAPKGGIMKVFIIAIVLGLTSGIYAAPQTKNLLVKVDHERIVPGTRIKVKFIELIEDARCPTDVNCVWAGNAKVKLRLSKGSDEEVVELNTSLKPQTVDFGGYRFKLAGLTPRPRSNVRISRLGYVAALKADKL